MGKIKIDLSKAKEIAHRKRRAKRAEEFDPLDDEMAIQVPGTDFESVEAQRQAVRNKYDAIQEAIDSADTPEKIKKALEG